MDDEPVRLVLSQDEALVLFELLARYDETDQLSVDGPAEHLLSPAYLTGLQTQSDGDRGVADERGQ
jgi:hypothetical protein